jgi:TonB family protein
MKNDNLSGAIEAFKRNLQIRETAFGTESKELAQTLHDLAMLSQRDGRLNQSIAYFNRLISIRENELGANHPDLAELLAKCAIILVMANKKKEAQEYEARARAIYAALPEQQLPTTVSPDILKGTAILKVQPAYPMSAKRNRVQGTVLVHVVIDEIGSVTKTSIVSGPNELRNDSEEAAKQWRFRPTLVNGRPVKVQGILTFNFTLQ